MTELIDEMLVCGGEVILTFALLMLLVIFAARIWQMREAEIELNRIKRMAKKDGENKHGF